ncbi:hypothetical protein BSKO_08751 [Bryopsis sp. KO-2023]|nr:hypothetical protein BSKO_08751 [Bryopsis sp. KO-2023]
MGQCLALPVEPPRPKPKHRSKGFPSNKKTTRAKTFTEKYGAPDVRTRFHDAYELGKMGKVSSFGSRATSNGTSRIGAGVDEPFKTEISSPLKSEISSGTGFCSPVPRLTLHHSNSYGGTARCMSMDNYQNYSPDSASTGGGPSTGGRISSLPRSRTMYHSPIKPQLPFEEEECESTSEPDSLDLELVRSVEPRGDFAPIPAIPEVVGIGEIEEKPGSSNEGPEEEGKDEEVEKEDLGLMEEEPAAEEVQEEGRRQGFINIWEFKERFMEQIQMQLGEKQQKMNRIFATNRALRQQELYPRLEGTPSPPPPPSNIPRRPQYPRYNPGISTREAPFHDPNAHGRSSSMPPPRSRPTLQSNVQSRLSASTRSAGSRAYRPEATKSKGVSHDEEPKKVQGETLQIERMPLQVDFGTLTPVNEAQQTGTSGSASRDSVSFLNVPEIPSDDIWKVENRELGRGASGCVYLCRWRGAEVAVKEWFGLSNDRNRTDMLQEAEMLGFLRHPCVISIYGHSTMGGSPATVAEFVLHGALGSALKKLREEGGLTTHQKVALALQTAYGMDFLHSRSIIHFDLKAANLLCDLRDLDRPIVKIADVGLSKKKLDTFVSGNMRGTLPWMAPELFPSIDCMANNPGGVTDKVNEKVDVYSYAIVLWEIWTLGEDPYQGLSTADVLYGLMSGNLRPEIPSNCEPFWAELMMRCWSQDPVDRPSFAQITKDLDLSYRNVDFEMV